MGHENGCRRGKLDRKVTVGDGVHAVCTDPVKAEGGCDAIALDREGRSCEGGGPERQHIRGTPRGVEAFKVAAQHLGVGVQMVPPRHRLCALHVGVPREGRRGVHSRPLQDGALQADDGMGNLRARFACPEADVGRYLIVSASGSVQAPTHVLATSGIARLKELAQSQFDVAMDVLADRNEAMTCVVDFGENGA